MSERARRDLQMIQEGSLGTMSVSELCAKYGYRSTRSYYEKRKLFAQEGLAGLMPRRRGPKRRSRRTPEVERRVVAERTSSPDRSAAEIVARLARDGIRISVRSVERVLREHGLTRGS